MSVVCGREPKGAIKMIGEPWSNNPQNNSCSVTFLRSQQPTNQVRWTKHAGYCWRIRNDHISDVLLWFLIYGHTRICRPAKTFIRHHYADTECRLEDLPSAMNGRGGCHERVKRIYAITFVNIQLLHVLLTGGVASVLFLLFCRVGDFDNIPVLIFL